MNRIPNNLQPPDAACRLVIFKVMCKERYLQCGELNLVPNCQNDKNVRTAWKQAPLEGNAAARYFTYHQRKSKLLTLFNTLLTLLTVFTQCNTYLWLKYIATWQEHYDNVICATVLWASKQKVGVDGPVLESESKNEIGQNRLNRRFLVNFYTFDNH